MFIRDTIEHNSMEEGEREPLWETGDAGFAEDAIGEDLDLEEIGVENLPL